MKNILITGASQGIGKATAVEAAKNKMFVGINYNKNFEEFHRINTGSKPLHVLEEEEEIFFTTSNNGVFKVSKKNKESTNYQFDPLDPFSLS